MSASSVIVTVVRSSPYLVRMFLGLFWMYIRLGHQVRKTRKAFEKQLIVGGMSKADAKRLSACYEDVKEVIVDILKRRVTGSFSRRSEPL